MIKRNFLRQKGNFRGFSYPTVTIAFGARSAIETNLFLIHIANKSEISYIVSVPNISTRHERIRKPEPAETQ